MLPNAITRQDAPKCNFARKLFSSRTTISRETRTNHGAATPPIPGLGSDRNYDHRENLGPQNLRPGELVKLSKGGKRRARLAPLLNSKKHVRFHTPHVGRSLNKGRRKLIILTDRKIRVKIFRDKKSENPKRDKKSENPERDKKSENPKQNKKGIHRQCMTTVKDTWRKTSSCATSIMHHLCIIGLPVVNNSFHNVVSRNPTAHIMV